MDVKKKSIEFDEKISCLQNQFDNFSDLKKTIHPESEALKIAGLYFLIGVLWILLSDRILGILITDTDMIKEFQLYKGWVYVGITGLIFYRIIKRRISLYSEAIHRAFKSYEELNALHEELIATDEEMLQQYDEIGKHRDALMVSNQRYSLVVEGANDGLWDWDLINETYFFSLKHKGVFGYAPEELENTFEAWKSLFHPEDLKEALEKVAAYLENPKEGIYENIYRIRCKNGEYRWILSRGKAVWEDGKAIRIAGSHTDITEQQNLQNKLHTMAYYDTLTGLYNKEMLKEEMEKLLREAEIEKKKMALIYLDIDNFKHINDILGHEIGDKMITYIANILSHQVKAPNLVARLGGDEFAVVLGEIKTIEDVLQEIEKFSSYLRRPWNLNKQEFFISTSIGVALYPDHGKTLATLMQNADTAMFHIKENGRDGVGIYAPYMTEKTLDYIQMSSQLRYGIHNEEFTVYYQPQIDLKTNEVIGTEALIRWLHPKKGFIPPNDFIPFAETTGYITEIEKWVFKTVVEQKVKWQKEGYDNFKVSVNLSSKMLTHPQLLAYIKKILDEYNISGDHIEMEVTETAIIDNLEKATDVLKQLKELNITIALDDFGTGYSSLTYLQKLPIDILKIDRDFIKNIQDINDEAHILKLVIDLAHSLGLKVVAEGVETEAQLDYLRKNHCDIVQGYYFSKPLPEADIKTFLENRKTCL